nr:hypothetical protein CFP56_00562 [Quercus suber]
MLTVAFASRETSFDSLSGSDLTAMKAVSHVPRGRAECMTMVHPCEREERTSSQSCSKQQLKRKGGFQGQTCPCRPVTALLPYPRSYAARWSTARSYPAHVLLFLLSFFTADASLASLCAFVARSSRTRFTLDRRRWRTTPKI